MTSWDTTDPARALDEHVHSYFAGHRVESLTWDTGPVDARVPGFRVAERDFRVQHGLAGLEERFQAARLDFPNASRASVV